MATDMATDMAERTIRIRRNTTSETGGTASRPETQLFQSGEFRYRLTAFSPGASADRLAVRVFLAEALPGIEAFIQHRREQLAVELPTTEERDVEAESELTSGSGEWTRAATARELAHVVLDAAQSSSRFSRGYAIPWSLPDELVPDGGVENAQEELETVDWDVQIEQLPPRRSEQVVVTFTQGSYRPPRIIDDPED